jgi:hypothetical protein
LPQGDPPVNPGSLPFLESEEGVAALVAIPRRTILRTPGSPAKSLLIVSREMFQIFRDLIDV